MQTEQQLKDLVREKYSSIALQDTEVNKSSCCGSTCCSTDVYNIMSDDYTNLEGYAADADLGLGCGLPTKYAHIKKGDVVIDLGSGAGNDCFVARAEVGETGKVIGVDFTPAMIEKARANAERLGFNNVEFRQGDIESMPVGAGIADVVVSNCVLNLVPNKRAVIQDIFRVLKPGGHFSISDVVLEGVLPTAVQNVAEFYAGCVSGAIQKDTYLDYIRDSGFTNITIQSEKRIEVPRDILAQYLSAEDVEKFGSNSMGIFSITVFAEKPNVSESGCCDSGCCQ